MAGLGVFLICVSCIVFFAFLLLRKKPYAMKIWASSLLMLLLGIVSVAKSPPGPPDFSDPEVRKTDKEWAEVKTTIMTFMSLIAKTEHPAEMYKRAREYKRLYTQCHGSRPCERFGRFLDKVIDVTSEGIVKSKDGPILREYADDVRDSFKRIEEKRREYRKLSSVAP